MFKSTPSKAALAFLSVAILGTAAVPAYAGSGQRPEQIRLHKSVINGKTVYCHEERVTGSLTRLRTCHTKDEWAQLGNVIVPHEQEASTGASSKADAS